MGEFCLVKSDDRMVFLPDRRCSNGSQAGATHSATTPRFGAHRWGNPLVVAALALLLFLRPGLCQEAPADASKRGPVTASLLEAKITETEAAAGIEEEAKAKLVELYRTTLGDLKAASNNAKAAEELRRAAETAPARIQALREETSAFAASPAEESLDVEPSIPTEEIERRLQSEKSDLAAEDARRLELEKRLAEEKKRPALIRQRLHEAREQREELAAQLELSVRPVEGPRTAEARRWALETRLDKLSTEIEMLDQELRSHSVRVELMQARRDRIEANVQRMAEMIERLERLVNRKRREAAEQAAAEAESAVRGMEGGHPSVDQFIAQNSALSEELARTLSLLDELAGQAEQADALARRVEIQFERAKEAIAVGRLTQALAHVLQRQGQSLPDLRALRRTAEARKDEVAAIGVQRLRHLDEEAELSDLDRYLAGLLEEAVAKGTPGLREQLSVLARLRQGLLEKAMAASWRRTCCGSAVSPCSTSSGKAVHPLNPGWPSHATAGARWVAHSPTRRRIRPSI
jgi:potassium efflux system protein